MCGKISWKGQEPKESKMNKHPTVAIVGATGAVGKEVLKVMQKRAFPVKELLLFASRNSVGAKQLYGSKILEVKELTESSFGGVDIAIFSAGSNISLHYAPFAKQAGCIVIDNSSAFRMQADVPLVVPEINGKRIQEHNGIIANPNCTTAIALMAVAPLHERFGLLEMCVVSQQSASGKGAKALLELEGQNREFALGRTINLRDWPSFPNHQLAGNIIPFAGGVLENGYTNEEMKLLFESRKILEHETLFVSPTCTRVPVKRAHTVHVDATFEKNVSAADARQLWETMPGLVILDNPAEHVYPTPLHAEGKDDCFVGRARQVMGRANRLAFTVVGDQILKGAALNAVQIAEQLL